MSSADHLIHNSEYRMLKRKNRRVSAELFLQTMILVAFIFGPAQLCSAKSLEPYFHKNAILAVPPLSYPPPSDLIPKTERMPISPRKACEFAIEHLERKGIKNIVICEVQWIAAPLSGYLVDTKARLTIDHQDYSTFRIGITDGFDEDTGKNPAGDEFVFIAFRKNAKGEAFWYPRPGPDYKLKEGEAVPESSLIYEFLINRERFETLSERYP